MDAAETVEHHHVAFEERLLGWGPEFDMERTPRAGQPHHEHPPRQLLAGDHRRELAEVTSASAPGRCVCGTATSGFTRPSLTRRRAT